MVLSLQLRLAPQAFARALRQATETDPRRGDTIASSKGILTQQ